MGNIKNRSLLFITITFVTNAQSIYKIPVGSSDNSITLKVTIQSCKSIDNGSVNLISNPYRQILNLPEGTPIIVKTYICNNNSISIETETNIEIVSTDHCKINYKKLDGNWSLATTFTYTEQTQPIDSRTNKHY